jgi:hypothetical protein
MMTPDGVYVTTDGGEWLLRRMANGVSVIGPWTTDSLGYWPTVTEARTKVETVAGSGEWQ